MKHSTTLEERLAAYTDKRGEDDCWPWKKATDPQGYGQIRYKYTLYRVSRLIAKAPAGSPVMHSCNNPGCCNPRHLKVGSYQDNNVDALRDNLRTGVTAPQLTMEQVREIRAFGGRTAQLAREFGVSESVISDVKRGRTYVREKSVYQQGATS